MTPVLLAGAVVASLLAGLVLTGPPRPRLRAAAALGALILVPVLLVASVWDSDQLETLRERPALTLAAAAVALASVGALALLLARRPWLLPLLALAALPFRVPIAVAGDTANLLLPLYAVIGAGTLAYALPRLAGRPTPPEREPGALEWLLAAAVVLYAVQASYSSDPDRALQQVVFFFVPFALLFALLARLRWTPRVLRGAVAVLGALAAVFVAVGAVEFATGRVLLNPRVIASNQIEEHFRVNSLFFDPNIYGRFLVVVMVVAAAALVWARRPATAGLAVGALAVLWGGLVLTLSQSSFVALLAGLAVLGALRWGAGPAAAVVGLLLAAGAAVVLLAPGAVHLDAGGARATDEATSGRYGLVKGGVELFSERPLVGWGAGAFRREYRRQEKASSERASAASHTIPITIAAEQGVVGLAVYLALLAVALGRLLAGAAGSPVRAAVAAAFVALVAHTMLYAAFLEDPLTWTLLAVGTALAVRPPAFVREPAPAPVPAAA